jgi:dimeric dUTPase (all-alpha-NTP-PPase superfamily)
MPDRLQELFDKQKSLQKRFNDKDLPADEPKDMAYHSLALVAELGEILECDQRWKNWKSNHAEIDIVNKRMEIADLFHFAINIALYSGMDADDLYDEFVKKNKRNHERQDNNY